MMKNNDEIFKRIQGVELDELNMINNYTSDFSKEKLDKFLNIYVGKRQKRTNILLYTAIGFLGIAGIQRFSMGQNGLGIIYLLTLGIFYLGTLIDLINFKKLTLEANEKIITEKILHLI